MSYVVILQGKVIYESERVDGCRGFIDAYGGGDIAKVLTKAQGNTSKRTSLTKPTAKEKRKEK